MSQQPIITQETFQESPYVDQNWEIVGEPPKELIFTPMEVHVVGRNQSTIDPMFRDYGGRSPADSAKFWHLPADLAAQQAMAGADSEVLVAEDTSVRVDPAEIERLRQEAHAAGVAAGRAEAEARYHQQLAATASKVEGVLNDLKVQLDEGVAKVEREAVTLALEISKRLVGHAVEINPEYITQLVKDALRLTGGSHISRVRISPQDFEFIQVMGLEEKLQGHSSSWKFEQDETIKTGCVVDTSSGEIDFQLDAAWERIRVNIMKVL